MTNSTRTSRLVYGTLALSAAACFAAGAPGQFTLETPVSYIVGTQPSGAASGDFNGDGHMDLATTADDPDRVSILLNDGSGGFVPGPATFLPSGSSPQDVVAGDFDGNGSIDLAVAVRDPQGAVIVLINAGGGLFSMGGTFAVGDRPRGMTVADIEGDGDWDIGLANRDANTASILTNNGSGSFSVQTVAAGAEPRAAAFLDFAGDSALDLAVTNHDARTISVYTNTAGSYVASGTLAVGAQVRPEGITAADLNGDGAEDLAVATGDQSAAFNSATIYINTGAGFAGGAAYLTGGINASQIKAADFDCDGAIDLAVSNSDTNNISVMPNIGGGIFGAATLVAVGINPGELTAADLDGDGDHDIAVANRDSNSMSVIGNQTCSLSVPGDVNGDGVVDVQDLLLLLSDWGPCPGCASDVNGDGVVDVLDLLALFAAWTM